MPTYLFLFYFILFYFFFFLISFIDVFVCLPGLSGRPALLLMRPPWLNKILPTYLSHVLTVSREFLPKLGVVVRVNLQQNMVLLHVEIWYITSLLLVLLINPFQSRGSI